MKIIFAVLGVVILGIFVISVYVFTDFSENPGYDADDNDMYIIYETPVESEDDCSRLEKYDEQNSVCYFECQTEKECEEIGKKIDEEFENLSGEYDAFSELQFNKAHHFEGEDVIDAQTILAEYRVEKNENFVFIQGKKEDEKQQKVIKWIKFISPDDFSDKYIENVKLVETIEDGQTLAYVHPNDKNLAKWNIVVAMDSFHDGEQEVIFTLIHEFSHILTLNHSQLTEEFTDCKTFEVQEGCLNNSAYLNTFYQKFWKGKFDEWAENYEENYVKDPNAFVTEYASVNPGEDIAESFARFVLKNKPTDTSMIKNQKIAFFYDYPELVKMRNDMRDNLKNFVRKRVRN